MQARTRPGEATGTQPAGLFGRDEKTGEAYLRLPVPEPETLQKIVDLLSGLVSRR